jgi:hypothetical protein
VADVDADGSAVHGEAPKIEDFEPDLLEERDERADSEAREVLVVDRVELLLLDEVDGVRAFDDEDPPRVEQVLDAARRVGDVVHVRQNVRGEDERRRTFAAADLLRERLGATKRAAASLARAAKWRVMNCETDVALKKGRGRDDERELDKPASSARRDGERKARLRKGELFLREKGVRQRHPPRSRKE